MKNHIARGLQKLSASLDLELAYTVAHHNFELGLPLENALKGFFRSYFPGRYEFGAGYLVDSSSAVSNQCDWIIYDAINFSPLIAKASAIDNVEFFPNDSVFAVVEVKRTLDAKALSTACTQIARTKSLSRSRASPGFVTPLLDLSSGLTFSRDQLAGIQTNHLHCGIYAYTESGLEDPRAVIDFLNTQGSIDVVPDFVAVHGKYFVTKVQAYSTPTASGRFRLTHLPQQFNTFAALNTGATTSATFYSRLLNQLNNTFLSASDYKEALSAASEYPLNHCSIFTGMDATAYTKEVG
jgi:hypothetical protein